MTDVFNILHVTPSFYPATYYGGPIHSTYALCNAMARVDGIHLDVLTIDCAGPSLAERVAAPQVPMRYEAGYDVYFTRRRMMPDIAPGLFGPLWRLMRKADAVLLTGTYSMPTLPALACARLLNKPVLWSPRGALLASHTWSEASRRRTKRLFEYLCHVTRPHQAALHVTSEDEKIASLARMPGMAAFVIPNGVDVPAEAPPRSWLPEGELRIMFIGRIDPVKALDNVIRAAALTSIARWRLDLYGQGEAAYVEELKSLAASLGAAARVHFHGHTLDDAKRAAFARADVCILASHSENFGMAAAEALAHGVPIIASRGVPWAEVEARGCGLWVGNAPETLAGAFERIARQDLARMGAAGRQWMIDSYAWEGTAQRMLDAMRGLAHPEVPPAMARKRITA